MHLTPQREIYQYSYGEDGVLCGMIGKGDEENEMMA